jgi:hypothetical protein
MLPSSLFLILAACAIGFTSAVVAPHSLPRWSSRHSALQPFEKRASGQFTYFAVGMGACGKQNTDNDFVSIPLPFAVCLLIYIPHLQQIVALNTPVNVLLPCMTYLSLTALCVNSLGMEVPIVSRRSRLPSMARRLKLKSLTMATVCELWP